MGLWMGFLKILVWNFEMKSYKILFSVAELKVKHRPKDINNLPIYNHTLATILVEYASAVSSFKHWIKTMIFVMAS